MILEQFYLQQLAQASYLIADEQEGVAAVVDPRRDVELYVDEAAKRGVRVEHVLLTHFHADFVAGHLELRERTGATIYLGARANAAYEFTPLHDGDTIEFGRVRLQALETPGHTPEGISILVYDLAESADKPRAILTGDTLFNGDVGRPDLMASVGVTAEELASMMYDSLRDKILPLPDDVILYPGHGAGSSCGKNMSAETWSTIGAQRASNYALQDMTREEFVRTITEGQSPAPRYFGHDATLNREVRATLDDNLRRALVPLSVADVRRLQDEGAVVLDARDSAAFASGHLEGSLNIPLAGRFCSWAGTVLDPTARYVVVTEKDREQEAVVRLGRVGFDDVAGYLDGGPDALAAEPSLVRRSELWTAEELASALSEDAKPAVLDVRTRSEYDAGHIAGAVNIPLDELEPRISEVPDARPLVVQCQSGYRSAIGASLLRKHGLDAIADLTGGFAAWQEAGKPVEA